MATVLGNLLAFVVAISILVAVHEFGHYIVGRWVGMKVLRFSIGFGKPVWTMIAGPDRTEYCISAIPLGGYVRFLDSRDGPIPKEDEGRAFNHRPIYSRIVVLLAGPLFNFLFAIVAYWVLFIQGVPTIQPAVGEVEPGSYAAEAGLAYGDRITAVGGEATEGWEAAQSAVAPGGQASGREARLRRWDAGRRTARRSPGPPCSARSEAKATPAATGSTRRIRGSCRWRVRSIRSATKR